MSLVARSIFPHAVREVPGVFPAMHWPSLGKVMAWEGGGLVLLTLLLDWFFPQALPDGWNAWIALVTFGPIYALGWAWVGLPFLLARDRVERFPVLLWWGATLLRGVLALMLSWSLNLFPGMLGDNHGWLIGLLLWAWAIASLYPGLRAHAVRHERMQPWRVDPIAPEWFVLATEFAVMLLGWALLALDSRDLRAAAGPWAGALVLPWLMITIIWALFARLRRVRDVGMSAPSMIFAGLLRGIVVVLGWTSATSMSSHTGGMTYAMSWFAGSTWPVAITATTYLYCLFLRAPAADARPLRRSIWAMSTAFCAEIILTIVVVALTSTWGVDRWDSALQVHHAVLALVLSWALVRVPFLVFAHPHRGVDTWRWPVFCVLSAGFAPVIHFVVDRGHTPELGTVYFQAIVLAIFGAGCYRWDARARARAGFES